VKLPRGLTAEEASLWAKVARTVTPLEPLRAQQEARVATPQPTVPTADPARAPAPLPRCKPQRAVRPPVAVPLPRVGQEQGGLDGHWERRIRGGGLQPDFTLDLHGVTLDGAYERLNDGLAQARLMGVRVVLLIAGKPRPVEAADRGTRRGAIRAKVLDWMAAGPHASHIAAIRKAHPRHGGEGALYVVMRRGR
jgi:DNA-nicking Smr family endonuclease